MVSGWRMREHLGDTLCIPTSVTFCSQSQQTVFEGDDIFCLNFLSLLNIHVLPSVYTFLHDCLAHTHWHHCPLASMPCLRSGPLQHCMFWETSPSKISGQTVSVSRAWMLQGIISSFSPKFLPVGSFRKCSLDWYLLCCFQYRVLLKFQKLQGKVG